MSIGPTELIIMMVVVVCCIPIGIAAVAAIVFAVAKIAGKGKSENSQ